jgi:uncharacterized protein YjbJ (UPF0337 family)
VRAPGRETGVVSGVKEASVGAKDKAKNKAQEVKGKVKEAVGKATDNKDLKAKGKVDQKKAAVKGVGEKVKDVFK